MAVSALGFSLHLGTLGAVFFRGGINRELSGETQTGPAILCREFVCTFAHQRGRFAVRRPRGEVVAPLVRGSHALPFAGRSQAAQAKQQCGKVLNYCVDPFNGGVGPSLGRACATVGRLAFVDRQWSHCSAYPHIEASPGRPAPMESARVCKSVRLLKHDGCFGP